MRYSSTSKLEIESMRAKIDSALGFPKQPDFVGENVRHPVTTLHAYGIEIEDKNLVLVLDDEIVNAAGLDGDVAKKLLEAQKDAKIV